MPLRSISRVIAISAGAAIIIIGGERTLHAQEAVTIQPVHVTGEEVPSSYGATPGFSRSRFSNLTQSYVLPPGAVFAGLVYQGDPIRFNRPDHILTGDSEFALPSGSGIAIQNSLDASQRHTQVRPVSLEG